MGLKTCCLLLALIAVIVSVDARAMKTRAIAQPLFCTLDSEIGLCRGMQQRYAWRPAEGRCVEFTYGGCHGNSNNFKTKEECEETCSLANVETD